MKKMISVGALSGFLVGIFLAAIMSFFQKDTLALDKASMSAFEIKGSLLQPFHITQEMIDEIRGINQQANKTNILNNWKLIATYISREPAAMFASGKEVEVLGVDSVLEGYRLKKVENMSATFEDKGGKDLIVYMDIAYVPEGTADGAQGQGVQQREQTDFELRQFEVNKYLKSPEELLKHVSVIPKLNGGVFEGVQVNRLTKYSFLYNFGVRKGDVIVSINGKQLNSVNDAIAQYQKLLNAREFRLTVKRNNEEKVLKYEVVN